MEVSPNELMNILNRIIAKHQDLKTDGFSIESCRSMVAVMDVSFPSLVLCVFYIIWAPAITQFISGTGTVSKVQVWHRYRIKPKRYPSLDISSTALSRHNAHVPVVVLLNCNTQLCVSSLGFPLNGQLYQMIIRRYSDENGNMDFDNYIGCLVRLDAMCRAFKTLDKDNNGTIKVNVQEWLQLTMYS
ncbi:calpain small subunit 1-like [Neolamprologus brichardi]|uniref:calpain small subunit 1-like n=1 Tax=Neolamprologus brichardi TaxID=32507 RepID=UPI001643DA39|nr:calpain small subunit 1-like [Neolamprologus brichardi]